MRVLIGILQIYESYIISVYMPLAIDSLHLSIRSFEESDFSIVGIRYCIFDFIIFFYFYSFSCFALIVDIVHISFIFYWYYLSSNYLISIICEIFAIVFLSFYTRFDGSESYRIEVCLYDRKEEIMSLFIV